MNLTELSQKIHEANREKGFYEEHEEVLLQMHENSFDLQLIDSYFKAFVDQRIALVNTELSEAVEANRKDKFANSNYKTHLNLLNLNNDSDFFSSKQFEQDVKDSFQDELADSLIRILDLAGLMKIDLQFHVDQKLKYNALRPKKHGKAY